MAMSDKTKNIIKYSVLGLIVAGLIFGIYSIFKKTTWRFKDNMFANPNPGAGYTLGFIGDTPHGLKIGDAVNVKQDPGAKYPQYDGDTIVTFVIDDHTVMVNKVFAGDSPVNPGVITK